MLVGASLSLSGPFQRQGERARDGLRLWVDHARDARDGPPRLIVLDDRSRATLAQAHVRRLLAEERVDVLVGPYSSGLVLAVAPIAAIVPGYLTGAPTSQVGVPLVKSPPSFTSKPSNS